MLTTPKRNQFANYGNNRDAYFFKIGYSAVSQAAKRFEQKIEVNHGIKKDMQKVITALKEI